MHHRYLLFLVLLSGMIRMSAQPRTADSALSKEEDYAFSQIYLEENWGGLKPVIIGKHWAFIGTDGKVAIPPVYDAIRRPTYYGGPLATLIIARKEKKWGAINIRGEQVVPFLYDEADFFFSGVPNEYPKQVLVKLKGEWGVCSGAKSFLIPLAYDSIGVWPVYNWLVSIMKNGKYGYFDVYTKREAFPPIYDVLGMPSNWKLKAGMKGKVGLLNLEGKVIIPTLYDDVDEDIMGHTTKVKQNGKWGVVDTSGNIIFPIRYDQIAYYMLHDSGTARVLLNNKWGEVDRSGKEVIPIIYDNIYNRVISCCVAVSIGNKFGVIDKYGKELIPVKYEDLARNWEGALWPVPPPTKAKLHGKWGFLDSTGREATEFRYEDIDFYYAQAIAVKDKGKWGLINKAGKEITALKYDQVVYQYPLGFICLRDGKFGIMNFEGEEITPCVYDRIFTFDYLGVEYPFAVKQGDRWGFLDSMGKVAIAPKYAFEEIKSFREGLAAVTQEGLWGYINKAGKLVVPIKYDEVTGYFFEGKTGVRLGEKWGLVDKNGKIISPLENDYDPMQSEEEDY